MFLRRLHCSIKFTAACAAAAALSACHPGNEPSSNPPANPPAGADASRTQDLPGGSNPKGPDMTIREGASAPTGGAASTTAVSPTDRQLLEKAALDGRFEVAVGNMAKERASDQAVRYFAGMVGGQHAKLDDELDRLAAARGMTLPSQPDAAQQQRIQALTALQGRAFDEAFVQDIGIKGHAEAIKFFEDASRQAQDPEIKEWFTKSLATLQLHATHAQQIAAGGGNRAAAGGPVSAAASATAGS